MKTIKFSNMRLQRLVGAYFTQNTTLFEVMCRGPIMALTGNNIIEPVHEISNNVAYANSKASDQPAHTSSLIRAFASRLSIL